MTVQYLLFVLEIQKEENMLDERIVGLKFIKLAGIRVFVSRRVGSLLQAESNL